MQLDNYLIVQYVLGRQPTLEHDVAIPHPIPDPLAALIAERFRLLGEPMRIRILDHLRDGPMAVGTLADALGASQQNVSKHLGLLHSAGLVSRERSGNTMKYAIADQSVFELCEHVCGGLQKHLADMQALVTGEAAR
jgi:DNA-binding transcriptional ArsR family regulator